MIQLSDKTNLLEQHAYHYSLQDVEAPNLYRDLFPFSEVPKISFNNRHVPMEMPQRSEEHTSEL